MLIFSCQAFPLPGVMAVFFGSSPVHEFYIYSLLSSWFYLWPWRTTPQATEIRRRRAGLVVSRIYDMETKKKPNSVTKFSHFWWAGHHVKCVILYTTVIIIATAVTGSDGVIDGNVENATGLSTLLLQASIFRWTDHHLFIAGMFIEIIKTEKYLLQGNFKIDASWT